MRSEALWLEELAAEARVHKAWLLAGWVNAAEALRSAIHAHESERGPLVEALFPAWRGASLRRHIDQALAAETELQRRLASGYVVRRLAELSTRSAVGPALEALAAAGAAWAAERDRPALAGAKANEVRDGLLAAAREASHLLERVRWLVRAALARRPDLLEVVFPKRTHSTGRDTTPSGSAALDETSGMPTEGGPEGLAAEIAPATTVPETERKQDSSTEESSEAPGPELAKRSRRRAHRRRSTEAPESDVADRTRERAPRRRSSEDAKTSAPHVAERTRRRAPRRPPTEDAEAPAPALAEPNRRAPPRRRSVEAAGKIAPAPEESGRAPHAGATRQRSASKVSASKVSGTLMSSALDVKVSNTSAGESGRAPHAGATRRRSATGHAGPAPTRGATQRGPRHRSRPPRRS